MSEVWKQFEKIMSEKSLVKTADKKDESYGVVPDKSGPDGFSEETGYELTEIAHPEQVQVANSRLNDGIVENGVERQKVMVDVALRNPRGVLAELMKTLVKAANKLEDDMTDDSLKMASEVDSLLEKLAQQNLYNPTSQFDDLFDAAQQTIKAFEDIAWTGLVFRAGSEEAQEKIEKVTSQLKRYVGMAKRLEPSKKQEWAQQVAAVVRANARDISTALKEAHQSGFFLTSPVKQTRAWNDLVAQSENVEAIGSQPAKTEVSPEAGGHASFTTIPKVQPQGNAPSKTPGKGHGYSVSGPHVQELQELIGADPDGKLGPQTFAKLMEAQNEMPELKEYIESAPQALSNFKAWTENAVEHAILAIKQHNQTKAPVAPAAAPEAPPPLVPPPAEKKDTGWERLDNNRWVEKATGRVITLNNPVPQK